MTVRSSSFFYSQIVIPVRLTYTMLCSRSLLGWLLISIPDLGHNLGLIFNEHLSISDQRSWHSINIGILILIVSFAASLPVLTSVLKEQVGHTIATPLFTADLITTVILYTTAFHTLRKSVHTDLELACVVVKVPKFFHISVLWVIYLVLLRIPNPQPNPLFFQSPCESESADFLWP